MYVFLINDMYVSSRDLKVQGDVQVFTPGKRGEDGKQKCAGREVFTPGKTGETGKQKCAGRRNQEIDSSLLPGLFTVNRTV